MKKKIIKDIAVILFALFIGVFLGLIISVINKIKNDDNIANENNLINGDLFVSGLNCSISDNKDQIIDNHDELRVVDNKIDFTMNIENYSDESSSNYIAVVLIDSVQTEFTCNNKSAKAAKIRPNVKGINKYKCTVNNVNKVPDNIEIILLGKGQMNYVFKFAKEDTYNENFTFNNVGLNNVDEGIYINSKYYDDNIFSSDKMFRDNDEITVPFLMKTSEEDKKYNIYLFNENGIQQMMDDKYNLCVKCRSEDLYEGSFNINNITEKVKSYKLIAVPVKDEEYNCLFSSELTVIGEE